MKKKLWIISLLFFTALFISACSSTEDTTSNDDANNDTNDDNDIIEPIKTVNDIIGIEDGSHIQNAYFNPLKDVLITNQDNEDITHLLHVFGNVDYGKVGTYTLRYVLEYGEDTIDETRTINVVEGTIVESTNDNDDITEEIIDEQAGSYKTGQDSTIDHPVDPQYIANDLMAQAIPSNGWWTSLLVQNYGGSNGIYTNPFRSSFSGLGMEVTNQGTGFVQYWNPDGDNTMANFSLALPDFHVKSADLANEYQTQVIDYSDTSVTVAMRNNNELTDHMVVTYTQGSPYIFTEVANSEAAFIKLASNGVSNYEFFTVDGTQINGTSHGGEGIIIKLVQKHIGYDTYRPAQVGQPIYGDRYFLISTPEETMFTLSSENHPAGLNNTISMDLNDANYFSIAPLNAVSEGSFYHEHAYNKPLDGNVAYDVDYENSDVVTTYTTAYQTLKDDTNSDLIQFLMPHHYQHTQSTFTSYTTDTIRGELKLLEDHMFQTTMSFNGVLPAMTHPNTSAFSEGDMTTYLEDLATRTLTTDDSNFLNDEGPYWNGKALYPLAQGIIIADQIGNESLKDDLIERLKYLLTDWFSVSSTNDERYLFYNQTWGTVYYSNNDFNTASELSDHSFTHGYLVYASSVLAMYDDSFKDNYGDVVELLLRDYMHPNKDDDAFAYLRSFDAWAGHTWAHGFGTFAEGNNIESSSEAINSWVGGYLWALSTGDQALKDAAIYGFVHELNHAKTYMFDYSETLFPEAYSQYADVAAMIWGGKYDYATWFGANPTFIYGIQWLPNGEYLSSYALNDEEHNRLSDIYTTYLAAKNNQIDTWFANMWSIQALIDPSLALNQFDATKILNDDYPSDLSQTYYLLHGLNAYGRRTTDYVMEIHDAVASSIYSNDSGQVHALIWNPTASEQTITFKTPLGETISHTVDASSFITIQLND